MQFPGDWVGSHTGGWLPRNLALCSPVPSPLLVSFTHACFISLLSHHVLSLSRRPVSLSFSWNPNFEKRKKKASFGRSPTPARPQVFCMAVEDDSYALNRFTVLLLSGWRCPGQGREPQLLILTTLPLPLPGDTAILRAHLLLGPADPDEPHGKDSTTACRRISGTARQWCRMSQRHRADFFPPNDS